MSSLVKITALTLSIFRHNRHSVSTTWTRGCIIAPTFITAHVGELCVCAARAHYYLVLYCCLLILCLVCPLSVFFVVWCAWGEEVCAAPLVFVLLRSAPHRSSLYRSAGAFSSAEGARVLCGLLEGMKGGGCITTRRSPKDGAVRDVAAPKMGLYVRYVAFLDCIACFYDFKRSVYACFHDYH
jgi:hypothetical protein